MKDGRHIDEDGTERWYRNGRRHREDGPAIIYADGSEFWYKNGKLHREDGPAIIYAGGTKEWLRNGRQCSRFEVYCSSLIHNLDPREIWS